MLGLGPTNHVPFPADFLFGSPSWRTSRHSGGLRRKDLILLFDGCYCHCYPKPGIFLHPSSSKWFQPLATFCNSRKNPVNTLWVSRTTRVEQEGPQMSEAQCIWDSSPWLLNYQHWPSRQSPFLMGLIAAVSSWDASTSLVAPYSQKWEASSKRVRF